MKQIYTVVLYLLLPLVLIRLLWRSLRLPDYRRRWAERFGFLSTSPPTGSLWIHAVSVGEVQAMELLIRRHLEQYPDQPLFVTTTTPTGSDRVRGLFGDKVYHSYFPYDLPGSVKRFLQRVQPRLLVIVETEIWPNLLYQCQARNIPVILANARLSARSAKGYARLGRFSREVFSWLDVIAAQSEDDARRFRQLGAGSQSIQVTGSVKFDLQLPASIQERVQVVRRNWGEDRPVWIAASTHEGEEEQILNAHAEVLKQISCALLVLVPRHPERFDKVAHLIGKTPFLFSRRSGHWATDSQVFLLDSMGELPVFIGAADVAFIGGSLVPVGGHNMLEAAAQGVPVLFGPHVFNFSAVSRLLLEAQAAHEVDDAQHLAQQVTRLLGDASVRSTMGENGRKVVEQNRGAIERLYKLIGRYSAQAGQTPG